MKSIIDGEPPAPALVGQRCDVYGEILVYLFYGRPAFRPFNDTLPTSLPEFRPICFLFKPEAVKNIARVVALDSGSFAKGFYQRHHGDAVNDAFNIGSRLEDAAKFVTTFFSSNLAYYLGYCRPDIKASPFDIVSNAYLSIVSDKGLSNYDDRRGSIEVQISSNVPINKKTLMAIALPRAFLDDDHVRALVVDEWGLTSKNIIRYDIYHDRPASDAREVMVRVKDYLERRKFLKT